MKVLRRRLAAAIIGVTALTLGIGFVTVGWSVNQSQQRQLDDALTAEARQEAEEASQLGGATLAISDGPGPMGDDIGPLTKYGAIYDEAGHVLSATVTFHGAAPALPPSHIDYEPFDLDPLHVGGERLRAVWAPVPGHRAFLLLGAPRHDLDVDARFQARVMWLVLLLAVTWVAIVVTYLLRRFTRGHEEIARAARRVADGDLQARAPTAQLDDEMAQLARDFNQMVERLSSLLASQREFIALAAHELRSPITTLYGELTHAMRRERDRDSYRTAVESSLESTRRLKALSEDLLTLARVEAHAGGEAIRLDAVAEDVICGLAESAAERDVILRLSGVAPTVFGRARDLVRMLRNLVENAIRHSPKGGLVTIELGASPTAAEVAVVDDGPGVHPDEEERLFEPFFRGSGVASDTPGAGLGLAIAERIARAHGGAIRYERAAPRGARFTIELPRSLAA